MKRMLTLSILVFAFVCVVMVAQAAEVVDEPARLPVLDGNSAKGLEIECWPTQHKFKVGQHVVVNCKITNTTDAVKPIGWGTSISSCFTFIHDDADDQQVSYLIPRAKPKLDKPVMVMSSEYGGGYILYVPPNESIVMRVSYKGTWLHKFRGRIQYHPTGPTNVILTEEVFGNECVYSNVFEYNVAPDKESANS